MMTGSSFGVVVKSVFGMAGSNFVAKTMIILFIQKPIFSSRERLAKGSGLVWNYGRVEVASPGGGGLEIRGASAESAENPRRIRGGIRGIDLPIGEMVQSRRKREANR